MTEELPLNDGDNSFITYIGKTKLEDGTSGCYLSVFFPLETFRDLVKDPTPNNQMLIDRLGTLSIYFQQNYAEKILEELESENK